MSIYWLTWVCNRFVIAFFDRKSFRILTQILTDNHITPWIESVNPQYELFWSILIVRGWEIKGVDMKNFEALSNIMDNIWSESLLVQISHCKTSKHNWYYCLDSNFTLNNGKKWRRCDTRLLRVFIIRFWDTTIVFGGHRKKTNVRVINILCSLSNHSGSTKLRILNQWIVIRWIKTINTVSRSHTHTHFGFNLSHFSFTVRYFSA